MFMYIEMESGNIMEKGGTNELAVTERVFAGHLSRIPAEKSNEVRVYLCSTSTDMQSERNWIMKTAVPRLRRFCQERGLSFQIVDLQWGVRDEVTDDHSRTELSLKVIQQCKNVSVGPYFVALLGDKYGNRPLVSEIEASEFKLLRNTAVELGFDTSLLTMWYLCDQNREPTMYVLQPITSLLPSFFDNSPMNNLQQQQAQREWMTVVDKLHHLFRKVTKHLYKKKKISQVTKHKYFQSVTDAEVTAGILEAGEMRIRSLCFQRTLDGISLKENLTIAGRYTDIREKSLDLEAEKLREQLRLEKIRSVLPKENLLRYNLLWDKHGLDVTENTQHKSYLECFGQDFLAAMRKQILYGIELSALYGSSSLMEEVLHHLHLCKNNCMTFCGREQILLEIRNKLRSVDHFIVETNKKVDGEESDKAINQDTVHQSDKIAWNNGMTDVSELDYFNDLHEKNICLPNGDFVKYERHENFDEEAVVNCKDSEADKDPIQDIYDEIEGITSAKQFTTPLVIYGLSDTGKTAITAKVMELLKVWFPNCVSIIRFLGMTSMSSSIREVLHSLCLQISHTYNLSSNVSVDISDLQLLINHFKTLLWKIDTNTQPLLIILDAVDQLTSSDHADTFNWLPVKLPLRVHLVISVVSDRPPWLKNLRSIYPQPQRYVEVTKLGKSDGLDMINTYCHQHGCHLARKQSNVLLDRLEVSGSPLFLKVLINKALSWKSYETIDKDMLGANVSEVMNQLFDKLETKHGHVLVRHALGYLCAAKDGLTDLEMEDLLSLDNELLQDVFMYHSPPDPDAIRIPSLLWKKLHHDICAYLIDKQSGGHRVMTWSHRMIMETASSRYVTDENRKKVNHMMAEYFQGVWSSKPKGLHLVKAKNGLFPNAHRQVPSQPIMYNVNIYNTRMLNCLSYHLIHSEKFETLLMVLFTNPEWLYAKCQTLSLTALLQDFRLAEDKLAAHIQTLRDSVVKAENMMPGPKKKEELSKSTALLKKNLDIFEAMKLVTKMILFSSDEIRKDPIYLPLQIIGQLGPSYSGMEPLEKLVNACVRWCRDYSIPTLLPLTDCLTKPGEIQLYTIEVEMRITGDTRQHESRYKGLFLQEETDRLFVVKQQRNKTDQICLFDLVDHGSCIYMTEVDKNIQTLKFAGNNRFMFMEAKRAKDTEPSQSEFFLSKNLLTTPIPLPHPHTVATMSDSGEYVVYTSECKVYVCFCKEDFPVHYEIDSHQKSVTCLHISPDDKLLLTTEGGPYSSDLVSSTENSNVLEGQPRSLIFDLDSRQLVHQLDPHLKVTQDSVITRNNILVCTGTMEKGKVLCYDMVKGSLLKQVQINTNFDVGSLQLHSSHQYVLCGFKEDKNQVVDNSNCSGVAQVLRIPIGTLHGDCPAQGNYSALRVFGTSFIYYAACVFDGMKLNIYYAGHIDEPLQRAVLVHCLSGHTEPIWEVLVPTKLDMLVTAGWDNKIKVWDLQMILNRFQAQLLNIKNRLGGLSRLEPSPQEVADQYVYTDTTKQTVTTQLCFNKYGDSLYVGTNDGKLLRYCTETGQLKVSKEINVGAVNFLILSTSGQYVIAIGGQIHVEDLQSNTQQILEPHTPVTSAAESNNILVCGSTSTKSQARVWNIQTGQVLQDVFRPEAFQVLAINSIGTKIVTAYHAWPVVVYVNGSKTIDPTPAMQDDSCALATCCAIAPDDTMAAIGADDGTIRVTNLKGDHLYFLKQKSKVEVMTFTPEGQSMLSAGYRSIYVWCSKDGHLRYKVTRHQDRVTHLKFEDTGQFFVSFSTDKQLVLWDFHKTVSIATFHTHCKISGLDISDRADTVAYIPEGFEDVAILKPNTVFRDFMNGNCQRLPLEPKAQALALAFSSTNAVTSAACTVM